MRPEMSNDERTDILDAVTEELPVTRRRRPWQSLPWRHWPWRRIALIAGSTLGALAALYAMDLLISQGDVPRGVTVAGVDVGGLKRSDAEQRLREQLAPRLAEPVAVQAGDVTTTLDPASAGLDLDWPTTLDQAGEQPLNPFTRISSFFTQREVGVVTHVDQPKVTKALERLREQTDRAPVEGTIRFEDGQAVAVEPRAGQILDVPAAMQAVVADWAHGRTVNLPVSTAEVTVNAEAVRTAMEQFAQPAVSGPVVVHGEGANARLDPRAIGSALSFEPAGGALTMKIDNAKLIAAAGPQLKSTEQEGRDARIVFSGGRPAVEPSTDGKVVDWDATLKPMPEVLKQLERREVNASYRTEPAKVTTEQANGLGISTVIGEFTTGGFAADSGTNIRVVAQRVDGAIVKPGETFSLNGFTGPRGAAQGYVEAGVIQNGAPGREIGGGISQFATTLYNAAYFAGLKDAGHKEHSYYISRYPAAREATVFQNPNGSSVIDLKFTNDSQTGVVIQTIWTPSSITVKLWGTKRYDVESVPGPRTNFVDPVEQPGPAENCHPSNGAPGFTTSDTRILRATGTGQEVRRDTRTVHYNPQPKIVCP